MYPASGSTAMPSGFLQPVTRIFLSEPSGLIEKTRPPLKSRTNRRSVAVSVAAAPVDREACCCAMSALQCQLAIAASVASYSSSNRRLLRLRRRVLRRHGNGAAGAEAVDGGGTEPDRTSVV